MSQAEGVGWRKPAWLGMSKEAPSCGQGSASVQWWVGERSSKAQSLFGRREGLERQSGKRMSGSDYEARVV